MRINDIIEKAPVGATHYIDMKIIERVMYYKKINGVIYWFNDCDFWSSVLEDNGLEYMKDLRGRINPLTKRRIK